ncbi:MAG: right-handed parallel beta-helix repeat-containing protein [Candidatus Zixiibacteriota bacterium]|nr:MAG: right-handed parallel beta-helix repeat-containing protein [candidate division Zixibacteria bacterium]
MRTFARFTLLAAAVLLASSSALSGTWTVGRGRNDCDGPCNFHDESIGGEIGGGIERAMVNPFVVPGDTVLVFPCRSDTLCAPSDSLSGGYTIRFNMKSGVVLKSKAGPDSTVICGSAGSESAITMTLTSANTIIDGFTISWDSQNTGLGGAIACLGASGTIRNCVFRNCFAGSGAAIYAQNSDVLVSNNVFIDNECAAGAGTIAVSTGAPTIRNNTFFGSVAPFGTDSSVLYASGSAHKFVRNIIVGSRGAPAIFCGGTNDADSTACNIFWDNDQGPAAGGCVDSTGTSENIAADPLFCDPTPTDLPSLAGICNANPQDVNEGDFHFGAPCERWMAK